LPHDVGAFDKGLVRDGVTAAPNLILTGERGPSDGASVWRLRLHDPARLIFTSVEDGADHWRGEENWAFFHISILT
jgi:hypothetical protein